MKGGSAFCNGEAIKVERDTLRSRCEVLEKALRSCLLHLDEVSDPTVTINGSLMVDAQNLIGGDKWREGAGIYDASTPVAQAPTEPTWTVSEIREVLEEYFARTNWAKTKVSALLARLAATRGERK